MLSLIAGLMPACGAAGDSPDARIVTLMTVNGRHPATVIVHLQQADAWVPEEALRDAGLLWRAGTTHVFDGVSFVSLHSLRPAVTFRLDDRDATLDIAARAESFQPQRVDLGRPAAPATAPRTPNAFVHYSTTAGPGTPPRYQAEVGATLRGAVLQSSFAWANGSTVRGPATLTFDRPGALLRVEAGEARLSGFGAAPSVGLLGVALSRQLGWDPALLRYSPLHAGESEAQLGVNCTVTTGGAALGAYDVFSPSPLDAAGTVTYQCTIGVFIQIQLQTGSAGVFAPRTLRSGAETLDYNLYLDAARTTVWGNGTAGTSSYSALVSTVLPISVPVYARIPARQDATPGTYSDSIITTIPF